MASHKIIEDPPMPEPPRRAKSREDLVKPLDPVANFTGPFRYFDLPREIRDLIYHQVWPRTACLSHIFTLDKGRRVKEQKRQMQIFVRYNIEEGPQLQFRCYPDWVLVSKIFLNEAMEQLYRGGRIWGLMPGSHLTTNIRFDSSAGQELYSASASEDLGSVRKWFGIIPGYIPEADYSKTAVEVIKTWPTDLTILKRMENAFVGKNGSKTLCISFGVLLGRIGNDVSVDLSAFDKIEFNVDELIVEVVGLAWRDFSETAAKLFPLLEAEVARLGHVLVGEGSRLVSTKEFHKREDRSPYSKFEVTRGQQSQKF